MKFRSVIFLFTLGVVFGSCQSTKENKTTFGVDSLKYAVGFSVEQIESSKLVTVKYPYQGATQGYQYLLVPKGEAIPVHNANVQVIQTPIEKVVCTSTTHVPMLDYLGETNSLIGFPTTDYISSAEMRRRIEAGEMTDLGIDKGMNLEVLYALHPDLVIGYTMSRDLGQLKKIQELGIPVVINAEYLEKHPLGRAEWIKFVALFYNKEKAADSIFNLIEREYLTTQMLVQDEVNQPKVLSGIVYGDTWFMPGGQNYAAKLFRDAGLKYLWDDTESNGYLELSFESVYAKAKEADLWIGVGSFGSLNELKAAESRYALFKPFQRQQIFTYDARKGAKGGSEFLELGYLRPDLILKDLVKIGHPEKLPDHKLFFHQQLK